MKLSVIIPFKNEEVYANITMERVYHYLSQQAFSFEMIAVDDSTDNTWTILQDFAKAHANVITVKGGNPSGYGKALRRGFQIAKGEILIPFNGDLSDALEDILTFIQLIEKGNDVVMGSRYLHKSKIKGAPLFKSMISRFGNIFLQLLYQTKCNDLTNSFKAYRKSVIEEIDLTSDNYTIVLEIALTCIRKKYTYTTIPITWTGRAHGVSKMSILKLIPSYLSMAFKIRFSKF